MDPQGRIFGAPPVANGINANQGSSASSGNLMNPRGQPLDEPPSRRALPDWELEMILEQTAERELHRRVSMFRRGGRADWDKYMTLAADQKRLAFKILSQFLCMFDVYDSYAGGRDEDVFRDDLDTFSSEPFEAALVGWNPDFNVGGPENFDVSIHMRSNGGRCLEVMNWEHHVFLKFVADRFEMSKVWSALEVACTLGCWGIPAV